MMKVKKKTFAQLNSFRSSSHSQDITEADGTAAGAIMVEETK